MNIGKKEIIFATEIEYSYYYSNKGYSLSPYNNSKNLDDNIQIEKIEKIAREIITDTLPFEMKKIFGIEVRTNILSTDYGSIILFFSAILTGVNLFANYKNLYDSIELIKEHTNRLIEKKLSIDYGKRFDVTTKIEYSPYPQPIFERFDKIFRRRRKDIDIPLEEFPELFYINVPANYGNRKRDGFFYFLLSLTIVLLIIVGILVYGAVIKTYFP
jgi:hypothetical protein